MQVCTVSLVGSLARPLNKEKPVAQTMLGNHSDESAKTQRKAVNICWFSLHLIEMQSIKCYKVYCTVAEVLNKLYFYHSDYTVS